MLTLYSRRGRGLAWAVNPLTEFHWRCWDGECVLFEARSGQTHLLDAFSATILLILERGLGCDQDLATVVAKEVEVVVDQDFVKTLEQCLNGFLTLGLIELKLQ